MKMKRNDWAIWRKQNEMTVHKMTSHENEMK